MPVSARVHTPLIVQMDAVECGAAALAIVLAHHGRFIPLPQLRQECGVSRDGSKASNLIRAAQRHGLVARGFSRTLDALRNTPVPCILFWEFNHFLVLEGFRGDAVYLNDPALGHRRLTLGEFSAGFTGVVLTLEPGEGFQRQGKLPSALPGLWNRLRGNLPGIAYMALAGVLLLVPGLALPALTKVFLDEVVTVGMTHWVRPLLFAIACAGGLQVVLTFCQNRLLRRLQVSLAARLTSQFFWHLLRLPLSFYSQRYAGEIVSRAALNARIARVLTRQLGATLVQVFCMLVYGAILLAYSPTLTLIGLGSAIVSLALLRFVARSRVEANLRQAREEGQVYSIAIAGLQGMESIKAANTEDAFFTRWSGHFANAMNSGQALESTTQWLTAPASLASTLAGVLILVVGGLEVIRGEISIGDLVAFQSLMSSFLAPVESLMSLGTVLQELQADVLRLDDVLQNPVVAGASRFPVEPAPGATDVPWSRIAGRLELRGVRFGYSPLDPPLLDDFSLSLLPGQRVALVGGSGSGKSTVAKVVCGLHEAWAGEILLDGQPVKSLPPEVLHNALALVEQDVVLFEGSVRENLSLWDKTVGIEALEAACRDASILDDVRRLPGGFEGLLTEGGGNLSGGQRQRLEIARALVNNPAVLILDEATSALDAESEEIIDSNLRRRGCTCLIIAHRLSTIRSCDEIVVMERGRIVERGTHEQLSARRGHYAALLACQADPEAAPSPERSTSPLGAHT